MKIISLSILLILPFSLMADEGKYGNVGLVKKVKNAAQNFQKNYNKNTCLIIWGEGKITPTAVMGFVAKQRKGSPEEVAREFLSENKNLFLAEDNELKILKVDESKFGFVATFKQVFKDIPVHGRTIVVKMDKEKRINAVHSDYDPMPSFEQKPIISWESAIKKAYSTCLQDKKINPPENLFSRENESKVIFAGDSPKLAYRIPLLTIPLVENFVCYIDAENGEVILVEDKVIK